MDYVRFALSDACQPERSSEELDEASLDRSVLDPVCAGVEEFFLGVDDFLSPNWISDSTNTTHLLSVLEKSVGKFDRDTKFVLSLSGGVDSMSVLVLLLKLNVNFAAVHIRHSSRLEDTQKELDWVRYACKRLSVPLYHHHVQVARPHATSKAVGDVRNESDLTREEFEDYTRQIRFGMYWKASQIFAPAQTNECLVLIGHHLDDVDENRIAELGKGNLINIDGMAEDDLNSDSVLVLRPLCMQVRKDQIREFAKSMRIPHMHNSTPKWSKRGWIRDFLDQLSDQDAVLDQLNELGCVSREIDAEIETLARRWLDDEGLVADQALSTSSKTRTLKVKCSVIRLSRLLDQISISGTLDRVNALANRSNAFAAQFNIDLDRFCALPDRSTLSCPIQRIRIWNTAASHTAQLEMKTLIVTTVFQRCFLRLKAALGLDKYLSRKSVAGLLQDLTPGKVWLNWKVNTARTELTVVQIVPGELAVLDSEDLATVVSRDLGGQKEALKKTITANIGKVIIHPCDHRLDQ